MARQYEDFAAKHLNVINISGDEAMFTCIVHDDSKASAQFNLNTGLWTCFACHEGGSIKRMCRELGIAVGADPEPELSEVYAKWKELSRPSSKYKGQPKPIPEKTLKRYSIPTGYWTGRAFSKKTIKMFGLGIDIMADAATIPLRNSNGELLGVIKRYLDDDADLRYRYPKGFKRSMNLFASWLVEVIGCDRVALCEGAVDAMKCWQAGIPAMAIYGSSISPMQVRLLRRLGVGQVVLFFDNDAAGKKAAKNCVGIKTHRRKKEIVYEYDPRVDLRQWFLVYEVRYKPYWENDPGAMSEKRLRKADKKAVLLNTLAGS